MVRACRRPLVVRCGRKRDSVSVSSVSLCTFVEPGSSSRDRSTTRGEYFFVARVEGLQVEDSGWTGVERRVVVEHRWWTPAELRSTGETLHPGELADILAGVLDHEDREGSPRRSDRAGQRRNAQRWASTAARAVAGRGEDPEPGAPGRGRTVYGQAVGRHGEVQAASGSSRAWAGARSRRCHDVMMSWPAREAQAPGPHR